MHDERWYDWWTRQNNCFWRECNESNLSIDICQLLFLAWNSTGRLLNIANFWTVICFAIFSLCDCSVSSISITFILTRVSWSQTTPPSALASIFQFFKSERPQTATTYAEPVLCGASLTTENHYTTATMESLYFCSLLPSKTEKAASTTTTTIQQQKQTIHTRRARELLQKYRTIHTFTSYVLRTTEWKQQPTNREFCFLPFRGCVFLSRHVIFFLVNSNIYGTKCSLVVNGGRSACMSVSVSVSVSLYVWSYTSHFTFPHSLQWDGKSIVMLPKSWLIMGWPVFCSIIKWTSSISLAPIHNYNEFRDAREFSVAEKTEEKVADLSRLIWKICVNKGD